MATNKAIKNGILTKEPCCVCGEVKVEAHHEDYTKPLSIVWLCKKHHTEHHTKKNRIATEARRAAIVWKYKNVDKEE